MLTEAHLKASGLQHRAQLGQGLQGGQGNHHHTTRAQAIQHGLQQSPSVAATPTEQDAIWIRQLRQSFWGSPLHHAGRHHAKPLAVGLDQRRRTAALLQGPKLQRRAQAQRFQPNRTHPSTDIPEHTVGRQIQLR